MTKEKQGVYLHDGAWYTGDQMRIRSEIRPE